ncbi:MAG: diadenylate cyclase [Thermodesulfobacteriota bacterium]|nr:diadenylate cyclase [Thermodesulfobacteriota bacterium]
MKTLGIGKYKFSQPLLASIFDVHSIGHDGAVVIDESRVAKFGCHLPLSLDANKFARLGLRHTAALGLSERCDALCIVVSEERGTITIFNEEQLEVIDNPTKLSVILEKFYEKKSPGKGMQPVSYWVKKNTVEKAVAILLALVLWATFGYQKESVQRDFLVPIEYRNISSEWEIEESRNNEATVTLMGSLQAFQLFDPATLKISVDLSTLKEGRQEIVLARDMIKAPSNLSLVRIKPKKIRITAYKLLSIKVPIQVETTGSLPAGMILKEKVATPDSITVLAPRKLRKSKIIIRTEPIDLSKITKSVTLEPKVIFPPDIRFKNGRIPSVKVTIEVEQKSTNPKK